MEQPTRERLIARIQQNYDTLPTSERAVADLLLEFPGDAVAFQSSELSARAGSSNAAVTRLIKRLGYNDFREVQKEVRDAQILGMPLYRIASTSRALMSDKWANNHFEADLECLKRTYKALDPKAFEKAVGATVQAKRVWTLGFRNGYYFADYVRRQLIQFRPCVGQLPMPGQSVMEDLGDATEEDLVIAVGVRRRPPQLKTYFQILQRKAVPVLYFTDHQTVSTAQQATWVFRCHTAGVDRLDSYAALLSLLGMFCTRYAIAVGRKGQDFNKNSESWVEAAEETDPRN